MRLTFDEIKNETKKVLVKYRMSEEKVEVCIRIHTKTIYDGAYSHGTDRMTRFVNYIQKDRVGVNVESSLEREFGAPGAYNENMGPGVLNALYCADRAMELANQYGTGVVGIRNTTRQMRGGAYGLYAVGKGYAAVMRTNTESCMPPRGGRECRLSSSPFAMAVPSMGRGEPPWLDMAVSQCSYGKLQVTRLVGEKLSYPGGFDGEGSPTDDPGAIEQSHHVLSVGYWKGSAFPFMLGILGSVLTDGIGATGMDQEGHGNCGGCSQAMIVMDPGRTITDAHMKGTVDTAVPYAESSAPSGENDNIRASGQGSAQFHEEHDRLGTCVDDGVWKGVQSLQALGTGVRRFYP